MSSNINAIVFQEVAENGADSAHLSAVHGPAIFAKAANFSTSFARHSWSNVNWAPHKSFLESECSEGAESRKPDSEDLSHRAYMTLRHHLILFDKFQLLQLDVDVQQIGPGYVELMMKTSIGSMCIFQTVTPMEPLLQKVFVLFKFWSFLFFVPLSLLITRVQNIKIYF